MAETVYLRLALQDNIMERQQGKSTNIMRKLNTSVQPIYWSLPTCYTDHTALQFTQKRPWKFLSTKDVSPAICEMDSSHTDECLPHTSMWNISWNYSRCSISFSG